MKFRHPKISVLYILSLLFLPIVMSQTCFGKSFSSSSSYYICFTPKDDCVTKIINTIKQAKKQILVQAYIFNDMSIAQALVEAKRNGVDIKVAMLYKQ